MGTSSSREANIRRSQPELGNLLLRIALVLLVVVAAGTVGYMVIEGWNFFDALYMVVITITTTGYGEIWPLSTPGRVLSIFLMVTGIGAFFYGLNVFIPALVGRRIEGWKKMLEKIEDHYLICGFGDVGQRIAAELTNKREKSRVVVIDPDPEKVSLARTKDYLALQGQPSSEETLKEANVEHAKSIVATMEDSENAFSVMVAKDLNPEIYAIAVSHSEASTKNIKRAGADYVLSPYVDTAKKASLLLHNPIAADFTEVVSEIAEVGMLQKISLTDSSLAGLTLKELDLGAKSGALVVAIEREGKILSPAPGLALKTNDNLYLVGKEEELGSASQILLSQT